MMCSSLFAQVAVVVARQHASPLTRRHAAPVPAGQASLPGRHAVLGNKRAPLMVARRMAPVKAVSPFLLDKIDNNQAFKKYIEAERAYL
jgi:hypothetical protein